jgi:hypothetical protein
MRKLLCASLSLILAGVVACPAEAADRDAALNIINKAIKAHGGEDALAKAKLATRTGEGQMTIVKDEVPFTDTITLSLPDRFKLALDVGKGQNKYKVALVLNGNKGWQATGGMVVELSAGRVAELREEAYRLWIMTLLPLKKETGFTLDTLPEIKVEGAVVAGVKISMRGHEDAKLYFSKKTGLLVKMERKTKELGLNVDKEYLFSSYKDYDGLKLPSKLVEMTNERKSIEIKVKSYKFPKKIDDSEFGKP